MRCRPLEFATCTVSWSSVVGAFASKDTVPLADIDPALATVEASGDDGFAVNLATKGRKSIKTESEYGASMSAQLNLLFKDRGIAERVATAMAHAATLCAKEPF